MAEYSNRGRRGGYDSATGVWENNFSSETNTNQYFL